MYFYFVEIIKNLIKKTLCPLRSLVMEVKMDGSHNLYLLNMFKNSTLFEKNFLLAKTAQKVRDSEKDCSKFCVLYSVNRSVLSVIKNLCSKLF